MRILFVCHRFPFPPNRGGKIRPFNIIKHLHARHEVFVASLARSDQEQAEGEGLAPYCTEYHMVPARKSFQVARMVGRLLTPQPSSVGYFYSRRLAYAIKQYVQTRQIDLIFVHCSSVAPYVADICGPVKVLDFGDMDSQKWLDYGKVRTFPLNRGYRLEGEKLKRLEMRLARQFDCCTTTTRAELDTLRSYNVPVETDWFANGVDHCYFQPEPNYQADTICFVGRMDYYPNQNCMIQFCHNVLPELQRRIPQMKLLIVGADPSRRIRELGHFPGVTVTGSVPDVRPYVHRSLAMVAPLSIARGTQNKILESMSMGVPVVCSRLAARGVDAVEGVHLLTADQPAEYIAAILSLIKDPAKRSHYAGAGRARIVSHHDWAASMTRVDAIIERAMETASANREGATRSRREVRNAPSGTR